MGVAPRNWICILNRVRVVNLANFQQFTAINVLSDPGAIGGAKIAPNCAQVTLKWTLGDGKIAHCVLGGRYTGVYPGTVALANQIFTGLSTAATYTALKVNFAADTAFSGVDLRDINGPGLPLVSSTAAAVPGTGTPIGMPNEVALCVTLRTSLAGRANRGRMYLAGWGTDTIVAGNLVAPGTVTLTNNWVGIISGVLTAAGFTWVIVQPARQQYTGSTGTVHPARVATSQAVTSALVRDNHWDSQRRRGLR